MSSLLWIVLSVVSVISAASIKTSTDPLTTQYYLLPETERENFLVYFLALGASIGTGEIRLARLSQGEIVSIPNGLGLNDSLIAQYKSMNIPQASIDRLVHWTMDEFELKEAEVLEVATKKEWCSPHGSCITIPDVNTACCPW